MQGLGFSISDNANEQGQNDNDFAPLLLLVLREGGRGGERGGERGERGGAGLLSSKEHKRRLVGVQV